MTIESTQSPHETVEIHTNNLTLSGYEFAVLYQCTVESEDRFGLKATLNLTLKQIDDSLRSLKKKKLIERDSNQGMWSSTDFGKRIVNTIMCIKPHGHDAPLIEMIKSVVCDEINRRVPTDHPATGSVQR